MANPTLSTIKQFSEKYPAFPVGGIRWSIFNADKNGLAESGAIIRTPGTGSSKRGRVLIHEERYLSWAMDEPAPRQTETAA